MEEKKSNRTRLIGLRLTPDEYKKIEKKWQKSTCRKLSEYIRHSLFEKPIVTKYRNQSADDFMAEMAKLRKELNHVGNNFNQAVKKLHTLQKVTEFKSWLIAYEVEKRTLFNKIDEIKKNIQKMAEIWLQ
ncbi:plasmid mobilization protein [Autumnicola musiva]|uniref:Plasmid mobilization relaxosome protein MobC n=1 Tax=Autumnicola musiva TaxID=3075589 RepID=A0ABU3DBH1_9FLAO|nr:plasmid mobilization relaxosome protein MobC [Zunongwangia sp. F117]MDT0678724.1 plasmid mobilization relaxosome protein MobC [Zunongwangia sp. F117]